MPIRSAAAAVVAAVLLLTATTAIMAPPAAAGVKTCSTSTPATSRPTLRAGDTGSCVKVAQQALLAKGYSVGTTGVDGDFGPATSRATIAFQRDQGLTADAVIGPLTWGRLTTGPSYNRGRGPNDTSRVVLTFDDCPKSAAAFQDVVKAARSNDIGLVLAPTGNCLRSFSSHGVDLLAIGRSYGQYLINHSVSHSDLTTLGYSSVLAQLSAPGVVTNYGRPPYGAIDSTVAMAYTAKGMRPWTWNVDTRDWTGKSTAQVVDYVVANATGGATVLMHMGWNGFTPTAIVQMKTGLQRRGLLPCATYHGTTPTRLPPSLPCTS